MAYMINAARNGSAPLVVPVGGPPGPPGQPGADSTVPGPQGQPGNQGADGKQGPAGAGVVVSKTATADVPLWTAIVADGANSCKPADITNPAQRQQVLAITAYGGMTGGQVTGQNTGDLLGPIANFQPGSTLFVGAGGALVSTPPTSGWRQAVASVVADGHLVINLGEATQISNDTALVNEGGFSTPASQGQAVSGQGTNTYATPDAMRLHADSRLGLSPYTYITDPAVQAAIRAGGTAAPASDPSFQAFLNDWIAKAGECGGTAVVPDGDWVFDAACRAVLTSPGRNRRFHLHFSPGAKLVPSSKNRFRYAVQGEWDAAANPGLLTASSGEVGHVWTVVSPSNALNLNGITNVNVGDQVYKGEGGWQKILCRANYRNQFWDASTNQDDKGNLVVLPGIGDEYECVIVGKAGTANIDGIASWEIGDEAIKLRGKWRKKRVQGGTFRGYWHAQSNIVYTDAAGSIVSVPAPALNNSNGVAGDWHIIIGPTTFAPISLGNGNVTGIGEAITTVPGEKIWCVAPGRREKCYASPLFRGAWNPATDRRRQQWYPAAAPVGTSNTIIGTAWAELPLASQGAYGSTYEITRPGLGTVGTLTRVFNQGEFVFFGANGPELVARDPNWDRGLLHFILDEKTSLAITGRVQIAPRSRTSTLKEWSEGWYLRAHSLSRADYANYLYQGVMLDAQQIVVAGDDADAGVAQGDCGLFEGVMETRNLYIPTIVSFDALAPAAGGGQRRLEEQNYPRLFRHGVRHVDSYVPKCYHFGANGGLLWGYSVESEVWSVEQASWEGGFLKIDGANMMTGARFRHGLRATPGNFEPTLQIYVGDLGFARYGIDLQGRQGTIIDGGKPILPGVGGSDPMIEQTAFIRLTDCADTRITNCMPTAGSYTDSEHFSAFLETRGGVFGTSVDGVVLQEMPAGVVFNLRHNANTGQIFSAGYSAAEHRVAILSMSGYRADTATKKLFYQTATRALAKGADWLLAPRINPDLMTKATDNASAAAAGVELGGSYLNSSTNALSFRTA